MSTCLRCRVVWKTAQYYRVALKPGHLPFVNEKGAILLLCIIWPNAEQFQNFVTHDPAMNSSWSFNTSWTFRYVKCLVFWRLECSMFYFLHNIRIDTPAVYNIWMLFFCKMSDPSLWCCLLGTSACGPVNECKFNNGECSQVCVDTYDTYYCTCRDGYQLARNDYICPSKLPVQHTIILCIPGTYVLLYCS